VNQQEDELMEINLKTKEIEEVVTQKMSSMQSRIGELELILDEKNEYIVRIKAKGVGI
jgi:hypothetical protein